MNEEELKAIASKYFQGLQKSGFRDWAGEITFFMEGFAVKQTFTPGQIVECIPISRETQATYLLLDDDESASTDRPDCLYYCGSSHLKCAVSPSEPCEGCQHYEPTPDAPTP